MNLPSLSRLTAGAQEFNYSIVIASMASISVVAVVIWTFFTSAEPPAQHKKTTEANIAVNTIEKLKFYQPAQQQAKETAVAKAKQNFKAQLPKEIKSPARTTPASYPSKSASQKSSPPKKVQTHTKRLVIGKGSFFVQVGAFKKASGAKLTLQHMNNTYKRAKIYLTSGLYTVWVGPVATKKEAETLKKLIFKQDEIKGFITHN